MPKTTSNKASPRAGKEEPKTRKLTQPTYKSFRLSKRIKHPKPPIATSFTIFRRSLRELLRNKWLFGGIVFVYIILTIFLVKGLGSGTNIQDLRTALEQAFQGSSTRVLTSLALFSVLLSNTGNTPTDVAGAYQSILLVTVSLALIWALRQAHVQRKIKLTVRDAFYKGLYPIVPFLLILMVITVQLLPMVLANFLYNVVVIGGLTATPVELGLWYILLGCLILLSLYMLTSSLFALYIVTLPDVKPMAALRSARGLVLHRRWLVLRKLLFLPLVLLIIGGLIIVPTIMVSPKTAEWLFYVLSMATLAVVHSYMYNLYRELIKE